MDWLTDFYLGCFIFGLVFTVATFLLGGVGHVGMHLGHSPVGHGVTHTAPSHNAPQAQAASHQSNGATNHPAFQNGQNIAHAPTHDFPILNYLNFSALVVFITWFGAAGYAVSWFGLTGALSLLPAFVIGVVGYMAVMLFLLKVLLPSDSAPMSPADDVLDGMVARVSSPIFEQGIGEVIYLKDGARRAAPARSMDGRPFSKDSKVVILKYEGGIAFVDDLDRLLTDAGAEKWAL